ncbi:hypothetical protein I6A84_08845 [Frankia sp. CNm7]|uniref:Uncharacterized protein n=1 Tax=Frankia nepalensis TaxID=1836974 RepID=A0A937UNT6_9ACTN|nr:hypothetical protein [Frankia nepalensis]MBL7494851.1 hypothetical protein [Frankia nepalensis]MBL7512205.1 hypothetical protein [Frankia nepalensis]MBL7518218.1 hypothetical protein [Frankia nepalensis]MBL7626580.1 hypothetical protein [Frankia nepalensis]
MIVSLEHDNGVGGVSPLPSGGLSPFDLARGLFAVVLSLVRVAVWEDGRWPPRDPPTVEFARDSAEVKLPVDQALADRVADILVHVLTDAGPVPEPGPTRRENQPTKVTNLRTSATYGFRAPV